MFVIFRRAYFTQHDLLKVHPCHSHSICQSFLLFKSWIIFHCMDIPLLVIYVSIDEHWGCFHTWAIVNNASMDMDMNGCVDHQSFIEHCLLGTAPGAGNTTANKTGPSLQELMFSWGQSICTQMAQSHDGRCWSVPEGTWAQACGSQPLAMWRLLYPGWSEKACRKKWNLSWDVKSKKVAKTCVVKNIPGRSIGKSNSLSLDPVWSVKKQRGWGMTWGVHRGGQETWGQRGRRDQVGGVAMWRAGPVKGWG